MTPSDFEAAFKPFEPMFHTVFYRQYPWYIRDDAKQEALLGLWKKWKRDPALLDQTRAFVTQAGVWAASPWRKKRAKIDTHEAPMPKHEHCLPGGRQTPGPDPMWVQRIDLTHDVELAICRVITEYPELAAVLEDVIRGVPKTVGRKRSELTWRAYAEHRKRVIELLREALIDYLY